ncbi:MAG: helix-turn-helix transcriptional regulator [Rhizobiaceae bacterium]|nr:helix-turn-helix transcriptional regulator [Rhizobiaceae bacterium]
MSSFASKSSFSSEPAATKSAGEAIRRIREAIGYSVDDLAVTCGLTVAEIEALETGADADASRLARVAAALQVPLSDLLN